MKIISRILILMMLLSTFSVFSYAAAEIANFNLVLQSYEPYPAVPGSYVDLKFSSSNQGRKKATDAQFELVAEYPFSLHPSEEKVKSFGVVNSGDSVAMEYKVRVDEKAVIGNNPIKLRYSTNGVDWSIEEFDVLVKITESVLSVSDVKAIPEKFMPGKTSQLDISLKNLGRTSLKDVSLKLDLETETSATTGNTISDLPFVPVESTSEKKISFLEGGEEHIMSFNLMTYPDATSKVYKIPVAITYSDESGNTYTQNDLLGVVVGAKPKLSFLIDSTNIRSVGNSGDVTVKIVNRGVTNLKFLNVMLKETDSFDILSTTHEVYIGNLDSDDYDTATFKITAKKKDNGGVKLPLFIEYSDANNEEYTEEVELDLPIRTASELGENQGNNSGMVIGVIIVVVVVVYYFYKKHKRKRRKG